MVAWREENADQSGNSRIDFAMRIRKGCKIFACAKTPDKSDSREDFIPSMKVWIGGPYGRTYESGSSDLSTFDHVLLIAQGMGVFALLPLMNNLAERSKTETMRTRRIRLVWDVSGVPMNQDVRDHLHKLMEDCDKRIRAVSSLESLDAIETVPFLSTYIHSEDIPPTAKNGHRGRINFLAGGVIAAQYINEEKGVSKKIAVVGKFRHFKSYVCLR